MRIYRPSFFLTGLLIFPLQPRFNQANSLHTHRAYIHADHSEKHSCPLCGRLYKTLQLLKRHCKINHQDENVDLSVPSSVMAKRQFYCSDCGESFSQKSLLVKHKGAEHAVMPAPEEVNEHFSNVMKTFNL